MILGEAPSDLSVATTKVYTVSTIDRTNALYDLVTGNKPELW